MNPNRLAEPPGAPNSGSGSIDVVQRRDPVPAIGAAEVHLGVHERPEAPTVEGAVRVRSDGDVAVPLSLGPGPQLPREPRDELGVPCEDVELVVREQRAPVHGDLPGRVPGGHDEVELTVLAGDHHPPRVQGAALGPGRLIGQDPRAQRDDQLDREPEPERGEHEGLHADGGRPAPRGRGRRAEAQDPPRPGRVEEEDREGQGQHREDADGEQHLVQAVEEHGGHHRRCPRASPEQTRDHQEIEEHPRPRQGDPGLTAGEGLGEGPPLGLRDRQHVGTEGLTLLEPVRVPLGQRAEQVEHRDLTPQEPEGPGGHLVHRPRRFGAHVPRACAAQGKPAGEEREQDDEVVVVVRVRPLQQERVRQADEEGPGGEAGPAPEREGDRGGEEGREVQEHPVTRPRREPLEPAVGHPQDGIHVHPPGPPVLEVVEQVPGEEDPEGDAEEHEGGNVHGPSQRPARAVDPRRPVDVGRIAHDREG